MAQNISLDHYQQRQNLFSFNARVCCFTKYVKPWDEQYFSSKNLDNPRFIVSGVTWGADKCRTSIDAVVRVMEHVEEGSWRPGMTSPPCPEPWCNGSHNKKSSGALLPSLIISNSNNRRGERTRASLHHRGNRGCVWGIPAVPAQPPSLRAF